MTFLEAAIEVLRHENEPLHFSEIVKRAVERQLLSHVGRDPVAAMQASLNSAVRGESALLVKSKPGYFQIRPGALPAESEPPPKPSPQVSLPIEIPVEPPVAAPVEQEVKKVNGAEVLPPKVEVNSMLTQDPKDEEEGSAETGGDEETGSDEGGGRRRRRRRDRFGVRGEAPVPQQVAVKPTRRGLDTGKRAEVLQRVTPNLEFEAPKGAGLEGVTDVAVVMANAMSRLAEERPELRTEFENLQRPPPPPSSPPVTVEHRQARRPLGPPPQQQQQRQPQQQQQQLAGDEDERPGRRRRRRRRRGRRVEGGTAELRNVRDEASESLLQQVAQVMTDAGTRSLHIRQIAETLAGQNVLGGEISEIERAVTAAILLDIRHGGRASRFIARGDARYQLHASRVPPAVTAAEQALHAAIANLNTEIANHFTQWLQTLGPRGLEAVARIWLAREGYPVLATLAPSRGIAKLVIGDVEGESESESEEEESKLLVLVLPRRAGVDPTAWAGDLERAQASGLLVFCMGEVPAEPPWGEARVVTAPELAGWLRAQGVGISPLPLSVGGLDPTVLESISGLDT